MKKVLLTVNNNRLSGIEKFTLLLAQYLDKTKYEVDVAVPTYGSYCELLKEKNINFFVFDNKINEKYTLRGIKFLFNHIAKKRYDIIHAQAGIAPCIIGKILGIKIIIEHKHGLDFTSEQIEKMNFKRLYYERFKKYLVDMTFTGCDADKIKLIRRFRYKSEKVKVIYNGLERESKIYEKRLNKKFTIGTIGRLTYQKAQEYFIDMANELLKKDYNFEFYIYGEGEKYNEYKEIIEKYRIGDRVFLKGYTKNISETIKTFDIFVLTSRYEGIPYVILEAMKESVPVVSTNVGGISEVIRSNFNGFLTTKGNVNELCEKAILLFESSNLRENITKEAKKDFLEKYTIDKSIKSIETIYSTLNL